MKPYPIWWCMIGLSLISGLIGGSIGAGMMSDPALANKEDHFIFAKGVIIRDEEGNPKIVLGQEKGIPLIMLRGKEDPNAIALSFREDGTPKIILTGNHQEATVLMGIQNDSGMLSLGNTIEQTLTMGAAEGKVWQNMIAEFSMKIIKG